MAREALPEHFLNTLQGTGDRLQIVFEDIYFPCAKKWN